MPNIDPEIQKQAVKEALTEWLETKVTQFGWFSLKTVGCAALAGLAYIFLSSHGWKP